MRARGIVTQGRVPLGIVSFGFVALALGGGGEKPLRPLGVCSVQGDATACWDLHGRPLSRLTEEFTRIMRERDPFVFMELGLDPGRKSRFLLLRGGNFQPFSADLLRPRAAVDFLNRPDDGEPLVAISLLGSYSATQTADLRPLVDQGSADLPLREGAVARIGHVALTVVRVTKPPRSEFPAMLNHSSYLQGTDWRFLIERSVPASSEAHAWFRPYGRDGKPIDYVDRRGKPLDGATARAALLAYRRARTGPDPIPFPDLLPVRIAVLNGDPDAFQCAINVDPDEIAFLRATEAAPKAMRVGPFPLDPLPSDPGP